MTETSAPATQQPLPWRLVSLLAMALFFALAAALVALRPVLPIDETRYLTVAWEMWLGGSKLVPHLNGEIYTHKPPLLFWLINLMWSLTGPDGYLARLITPAFGALAVGLTAALARTLWPADTARPGMAAMMLATTGVFALYGSLTMFDTMLTVATLAAMLALWQMAKGPGLAPALGLGGALALGVFAKGPVILLHVMPAALLMPLWADAAGRPAIGRWYARVGIGFGVALALVAIWLGPALVLGGAEYRNDVLWRQSAGRIVTSFAHDRPVWSYALLLPLYLWPWGWSLAALANLSPRRLIATPQTRLLAIWGLSAFAAFSLISGKQVHYLLPELPVLALLFSGAVPSTARLGHMAALVLPVGLLAAVVSLHTEVPLNTGFAVAALGLLLALAAALWRWPLARLAVTPVTLLMAHLLVWPLLRAQYDTTPLATLMAAHEAQGLAVLDPEYHGEFTFTGGLTTPVAVLGDSADAWIAAHPGGALLTWSEQTDPRLTLQTRRIFRDAPVWLYTVAP